MHCPVKFYFLAEFFCEKGFHEFFCTFFANFLGLCVFMYIEIQFVREPHPLFNSDYGVLLEVRPSPKLNGLVWATNLYPKIGLHMKAITKL